MDAYRSDGDVLVPRNPHLAERVADVLRERILDGTLPGGSVLARQEDLLAEFGVSKPSLREAFRILETEGLITVKRGKIGGAVVHAPRPESAAYTMALVMQSRDVRLNDVGKALRHVEPECAALCAERPDRASAVVPALRAVHEQAIAAGDNPAELTRLARRFHELFVELCGNQTMILLVGTLESLWSVHEREWARSAQSLEAFRTEDAKHASHREHGRILQLIEDGNVDGVTKVVRRHLEQSVFYAQSAGSPGRIRASALKAPSLVRPID